MSDAPQSEEPAATGREMEDANADGDAVVEDADGVDANGATAGNGVDAKGATAVDDADDVDEASDRNWDVGDVNDEFPNYFRKKSILAFDGGGTKGVTEVFMLNQVMRLATIIWESPQQLQFLFRVTGDGLNLNKSNREKLFHLLEDFAGEALHPSKVFDMMIGTSTGSFIAFLLGLGVLKDPSDDVCKPDADGSCGCEFEEVSVSDMIQLYKDLAPEIFKEKAPNTYYVQRFLGWLFSVQVVPYTQNPLRARLASFFGRHPMGAFRNRKCVVGAVAHKVLEDRAMGDVSVLFDTRNADPLIAGADVTDVVAASADAPFYFVTPSAIGDEKFIDGGITANCPINEGIGRADDIWDEHSVAYALSLSPSERKVQRIPSSWLDQMVYWIKYFVECLVSGDVLFRQVQNAQPDITLVRLTPPPSQFFDKLGIDSLKIDEMLAEMKRLTLEDPQYVLHVIVAAILVALVHGKKQQRNNESAEMAKDLAAKFEFLERLNRGTAVEFLELSDMRHAYAAYKRSKGILKALKDDGRRIKEVMFHLANTIKKLGKVKEAIKEYKKILALPRGFFKKVQSGEIEDPDSFFTRITDVDRVAQATILQGIAEHYVREAEWGKARVAVACADKVLQGEDEHAKKLRKELEDLLKTIQTGRRQNDLHTHL